MGVNVEGIIAVIIVLLLIIVVLIWVFYSTKPDRVEYEKYLENQKKEHREYLDKQEEKRKYIESVQMDNFCPITNSKCRKDCSWFFIFYDIDKEGVGREFSCALSAIADNIVHSNGYFHK